MVAVEGGVSSFNAGAFSLGWSGALTEGACRARMMVVGILVWQIIVMLKNESIYGGER